MSWNAEDGQAMVEYALILALVAAVVVAGGALTGIGTSISEIFQAVADVL